MPTTAVALTNYVLFFARRA